MTDTVRQLYLRVSDDFEYCFNIAASAPLTAADIEKLRQLLGDGFVSASVTDTPRIAGDRTVEVGPRLNFATAWSSNLVSICQAIGIPQATRVERSRRYRIPAGEDDRAFVAAHHDRMTECVYPNRCAPSRPASSPRRSTRSAQGAGTRRTRRDPGISMDEWTAPSTTTTS